MDELRKNGVDVDVQILSSHINYVLPVTGSCTMKWPSSWILMDY